MGIVMLFLSSAVGGGSLMVGIILLEQGDRLGWGYLGIAVVAFALAAVQGWRMRTELAKRSVTDGK